jgi:hypothetical protein
MRKKPLLAVALCTAALAGASASAAFAGEVIGPPGSPFVLNEGATSHANSICAFSGLNDGEPPPGIVQSPGQDVSNGGPPGIPGEACGPGTNPRRGTPPFK